MGPPFFDGGNSQIANRKWLLMLASMGPPFFDGGNHRCYVHDSTAFRASMGPPFFDGGNGWAFGGEYSHNVAASMGPPFFDGGNAEAVKAWSDDLAASMGPPFFDGGNLSCADLLEWMCIRLQWGRRFLTAETRVAASRPCLAPSSFNGAAVF